MMQKVTERVKVVSDRVGCLPGMRRPAELALRRPKEIVGRYIEYIRVLERLVGVSEEDVAIATEVNSTLGKHGGLGVFVSGLSVEQKGDLKGFALEMADVGSDKGRLALDELLAMMGKAQNLKDAGLVPIDGDSKSDQVIWGYTQMGEGAEFDWAKVDFTICHGIERTMAACLRPQGVEFAWNKDFLLNTMTDVLVLDHFSGCPKFGDIFDLWKRPRINGGLGWISEAEIAEYQKKLQK